LGYDHYEYQLLHRSKIEDGGKGHSHHFFCRDERERRERERRRERQRQRTTLTSSGTTCVRLHIAHVDFSTPSGDNTRGRSLKSGSGLGGAFHLARGGGERLCTMRPAKSSLFGKLCTLCGANSALRGSICAPLVAATFPLRSMPDANTALNGSICAPLVAATKYLCAMRDANSAFLGEIGAPGLAATLC
jgi:hypothetical protein